MESAAHSTIKRLALAHLRREGYAVSACEVRSPIARWIADVAGWRDSVISHGVEGSRRRVRLEHAQTIIIECKQSRGDFLRDSRRLDALLALRERLQGIRESIERHRIRALEPQLRVAGASLFAELDEWNYAASRLPSYRRVVQRIERIDERVYGQTKFFRLARYALADQLWLAAPRGLIARREVPHGWGLLEAVNDGDSRSCARAPESLVMTIDAPRLVSRDTHRQRLLRNIALAACVSAPGRALPAAAPVSPSS
jgi:hypothetical protein